MIAEATPTSKVPKSTAWTTSPREYWVTSIAAMTGAAYRPAHRRERARESVKNADMSLVDVGAAALTLLLVAVAIRGWRGLGRELREDGEKLRRKKPDDAG
jgi:hypothetical protein